MIALENQDTSSINGKYKLNNQAIVEAVERVIKENNFFLINKKPLTVNGFFSSYIYSKGTCINSNIYEHKKTHLKSVDSR
jgi:hypothetical protein